MADFILGWFTRHKRISVTYLHHTCQGYSCHKVKSNRECQLELDIGWNMLWNRSCLLCSNFKELSKIFQCGTGKDSLSLTMPISDIRPFHMKTKTTAQMSLATFCAVSNPTLWRQFKIFFGLIKDGQDLEVESWFRGRESYVKQKSNYMRLVEDSILWECL